MALKKTNMEHILAGKRRRGNAVWEKSCGTSSCRITRSVWKQPVWKKAKNKVPEPRAGGLERGREGRLGGAAGYYNTVPKIPE